MTAPCSTFCMRFTLRADGHRCADCGMTVEQACYHHEPHFDRTGWPYGKSGTDEPAYKAFQNWYQKVRVLGSGVRHVDLTYVTERDVWSGIHGPQDLPCVYLLGHDGSRWGIIARDHEVTAWSMFVPVYEESLPTERRGVKIGKQWVLPEHMAFVAFNTDPRAPGFIHMALCECGWFRLASEPACTQHDDSPGFPVPDEELAP